MFWRRLGIKGPARGPDTPQPPTEPDWDTHPTDPDGTAPGGPPPGTEPAPGAGASGGFDVVAIILRCRRTADLSQRELATRLDVSPSVVARWETGQRIPRADQLAAIIELAGYHLAMLDHHDQPVPPAPAQTLRDRGGRRLPAHLDVELREDDHWRRNPRQPNGWEHVHQTVHTHHRDYRDLMRDLDAHTTPEQAPGCVPFHTTGLGQYRRCRDIPSPHDLTHWKQQLTTWQPPPWPGRRPRP